MELRPQALLQPRSVLQVLVLCGAVVLAAAEESSSDAEQLKTNSRDGDLTAVMHSSQGAGRMSKRVQPRRKMPPLALIASMDGTMTAVKADTGSKLWTIDLGGKLLNTWQNRSVFNEHSIIPNTDGSLYLFSGSDTSLQRLPITLHDLVEHSPFVADDGTVYVAQKKSQLMVVDRTTGKVLASVASDSLDESYHLKHGEVGLLIGRYEYIVKAVDPYTNEMSWTARLSYVPSVRILRREREILPPLPDHSQELDPGTYFYNQDKVYAVNRKTGEVSWWLDTAAPAVAVHVLGDHPVSEERLLIPSSAPLEGDVDLWNSRLLVSEDFQYIQIHDGQPFATNGVLEPPTDGLERHEAPRSGARKPWEAPEAGNWKVQETWNKDGDCCVDCAAYPRCLRGIHSVHDTGNRPKQHQITRPADVPLLPAPSESAAIQLHDQREHSAQVELNFDQAVMSSLLQSAFGDEHEQKITVGHTPHPMSPSSSGSPTSNAANSPLEIAQKPEVREGVTPTDSKVGDTTLFSLWSQLVLWTAHKFEVPHWKAELGLLVFGILVCLAIYIELGHRFNSAGAMKSWEGKEEPSIGMPEYQDEDSPKKKRKGGQRGGKTLRRRKAAMEKGGPSESASFESAEEGESEDEGFEQNTNVLRIGRLEVNLNEETMLGQGSQGTIVYPGTLDHRQVAVKRLLAQFFEVAKSEIDLLIKADAHPHVVRYFAKEQDGDFIYLALELCEGSLARYIDRNSAEPSGASGEVKGVHAAALARKQLEETAASRRVQTASVPAGGSEKDGSDTKSISGESDRLSADAVPFVPSFEGRNFCEDPHVRQMIQELLSGVAYLHSLGIVHRDLKPGNVLLSTEGSIKISDMGLSKRLDKEQSSFETLNAGTIGWRAPELIMEERCTKAVDIFAVGCIMHYLLTGGHHVFGERVMRDANIVRDQPDTSRLAQHPEARDLVLQLVRRDPKQRPTAAQALSHPFFWSQDKCLRFLLDCSDRVENETPTSDLVQAMDKHGAEVFAGRWDERLDPAFIATLLERRKYNYSSLRDLLRAIRNKKNHFRELPEEVQNMMGSVPDGYMQHFRRKFPCIVLAMYSFVKEQAFDTSETIFQKYFST